VSYVCYPIVQAVPFCEVPWKCPRKLFSRHRKVSGSRHLTVTRHKWRHCCSQTVGMQA